MSLGLREKIKKLKDLESNRRIVVKAIKEYQTLVHERRRFTGGISQPDTSVFAVEDSIQPFVEDAVKTIYSLIWDATGVPFTISHNDEDLRDSNEVFEYYEIVAKVLQIHSNDALSNFKFALEQMLKMLLEYGSAVFFVTEYQESFFCEAYSLQSCYIGFDDFKKVTEVLIEKGKKQHFFERKKDNKWHIQVVDHTEAVIYDRVVSYTPIFFIYGNTPNVDQVFPIGSGISSLPEIRKVNAIIEDLTVSAKKVLTPIMVQDPSIDIENRSSIALQHGAANGPLKVSTPMVGNQQPIGYIPIPANDKPAWELWEQLVIKMREKFGFVNRLLTLKDNTQITATEATIRSKADMNQLKNLMDNVLGRFLSPLHISQMRILKAAGKLPDVPEVLKGDEYDISFSHTSIFKKQEEQERLEQIRNGILLLNEVMQISANAKQVGVSSVNFPVLIDEISRLLRLPTEQTGGILEGILGQIAEAQMMQQQDPSMIGQGEVSPEDQAQLDGLAQ